MATFSELVRITSEATGVPLATVVDFDRKLVKGKLRSVSGRGFNAARVTALDAARLLTAILASPQANAAAEAVMRYTQTRPDKSRSSEKFFWGEGLEDLAVNPARHGFVDGLACLIASVAGGGLAKVMAKGQQPHIEVFTFTRAVHGRIRISGLPHGNTANVEYIPLPSTSSRTSKLVKGRGSANDGVGDLEQSRRITERTIFAVGRLLAKERGNAE